MLTCKCNSLAQEQGHFIRYALGLGRVQIGGVVIHVQVKAVRSCFISEDLRDFSDHIRGPGAPISMEIMRA